MAGSATGMLAKRSLRRIMGSNLCDSMVVLSRDACKVAIIARRRDELRKLDGDAVSQSSVAIVAAALVASCEVGTIQLPSEPPTRREASIIELGWGLASLHFFAVAIAAPRRLERE